jgi:CBS domain containing-hemolysin-like protein
VDVDGRVLLSDLERDEGIVLRPEHAEAETIAAYFLGRLGRPPNTGERVECDGYVLTAMDVAGRRLRRARIVELPRAEA